MKGYDPAWHYIFSFGVVHVLISNNVMLLFSDNI